LKENCNGAATFLARIFEAVARHLPVAMLPATSEAEKVRFHTLNRATGNRVHARYVDAETGKPVENEDQVKGYEREDGEYVDSQASSPACCLIATAIG
jgi:non-homologous end joining protein Ku